MSPRRLSATALVDLVDVTASGPAPAYRRWANALAAAILDGRLPDDTRLPSERSLAEAARVSRTTTTRAYELLRERGIVATRHGSGTAVRLPVTARAATSMLTTSDEPGVISLTAAAMSAPPQVASLVRRAADGLPSLLATNGYLPDGLPLLRERLAQRYTEQGLATDPEQIIVTNGAQGALALVVRTLCAPGDRVMTEASSYPHAFDTIAAAGARFVPLPAALYPWSRTDVERAAPIARMAYLIPDFHNPTGAVMEPDDRAAIAATLRRENVVTIVDETTRDVRIDGTPLPRFATWHHDTITLGSASKVLWGGLRIGWVRAPHALVPRLVQARMHHDLGSSAFDQLVVAEAVAAGWLDDSPLVPLARERRDTVASLLAERLPTWTSTVPAGGLSFWARLPRRAASALTIAAEAEGVRVTPGPRFFGAQPSSGEAWIRVPFTRPPDVMDEAVARLARAWHSLGPDAEEAVRDPDAIDLIA